MVKCDICKKAIETTFMNKILGTYIKKEKKSFPVCSECQSKLKKEEILEKI